MLLTKLTKYTKQDELQRSSCALFDAANTTNILLGRHSSQRETHKSGSCALSSIQMKMRERNRWNKLPQYQSWTASCCLIISASHIKEQYMRARRYISIITCGRLSSFTWRTLLELFTWVPSQPTYVAVLYICVMCHQVTSTLFSKTTEGVLVHKKKYHVLFREQLRS